MSDLDHGQLDIIAPEELPNDAVVAPKIRSNLYWKKLLADLSSGWWSGNWNKRFLLWFWFPLAAAVFLVGGLASVHFFEGDFDWRYRTLSSLSSEVTNPKGYAYCCFGLMLSFTLAMPLCGYFRARVQPIAPRLGNLSCHWLRLGFIGSVAVGLERLFCQSVALHFGKVHEYISLITFVGLALGLSGFNLGLLMWLLRERKWPLWAISGSFILSSTPILGTGLSQGYLYFVPNELGWVGPHWAELGVPIYLSLAFWEWLLSAAIFTYLYLILLLLPAHPPVRVMQYGRRANR
jgi:hypothetical protein